jgi:hypothetical protein
MAWASSLFLSRFFTWGGRRWRGDVVW